MNNLKSLMLFGLVFLVLFGPRLKIIDVYLLFNLIFAILGFLMFWLLKFNNKRLIILIALLILILFYFIILHIFNSAFDTFIYQWLATFTIYIYSSYALVKIFNKLYADSFMILTKHIFWATVINATVVVIVFISPDVGSFLLDMLNFQSNQEIWLIKRYRSFDLSMGGGTTASIVFAMAIYLGLIIKNQTKHFFLVYTAMIILLMAALMTGRTGFILALSIIPFYYFVVNNIYLKPDRVKLNYRYKYFQYFVVCFSIVIFVNLLTSFFIENDALARWAFELFISGSSGSTDIILGEMIFFPETTHGFLFGEGTFGRNDKLMYVPSDIGYIRSIFGGGVLGMILMYLPLVIFLIIAIREIVRNKSLESSIVLLFVLIYLIVNLKELHYGARSSMVILMIYVSFMYNLSSKRYLKTM